jgi:hypothetical protein
MSFLSEIKPGTPFVLGLTETGQGKATGAATILPHLGEVPILRPSDGALPTRILWNKAHKQYEMGPHKPNYDAMRTRGIPKWKLYVANVELVTALNDTDTYLLSMHGAFGYGAKRTVVEIDTKVEPAIAHRRTQALVPLPETADELRAIGRDRGIKQDIEVIGFLVPEELKDPLRKQRRIETFSQKEPTKENPLRVAFMTTGQFAHQDILTFQMLHDPQISEWIKNGQMKLDIYMWNSNERAAEVAKIANYRNLQAIITQNYQPYAEYNTQVFHNDDPLTAVRGAIHMGFQADVVISALAERVGWSLEVPFISLPPVGSNTKMLANTYWAERFGLSTPYAEVEGHGGFGGLLKSFFEHNGAKGRQHFDNAEWIKDQFDYGDLAGGAHRATNIVLNQI